jgi:hypothetical protein
MSGESEYFNPIIQGLAQIAQGRQARAQNALDYAKLAETTKQHKAENDARQQEIDHMTDQLDVQHEFQTKSFDLAQKRAAIDLEDKQLFRVQLLQALKNANVNIDKIPGIMHTLPTAGQESQPIPSSAFSTPEQTAQLAANAKGAETTAVASAQQPFIDTNQTRANTQAISLANVNNSARHADVILEQNAANARSHETNQRFLRIASGGGDPTSPENTQQAADWESLMSGQGDYNKLPKNRQAGVEAYRIAQHPDWVIPRDGKAFKSTLDNLTAAQETIEQGRKLGQNFSSDSPNAPVQPSSVPGFLGPTIGGAISGLANKAKSSMYGTEANSQIADFNGKLGNLVHAIDAQTGGRIAQQEIERQKQGGYQPTATMAQNAQKIADTEAFIHNKMRSALVGMPKEQRDYIAAQHPELNGFMSNSPTQQLPPGHLRIKDSQGKIQEVHDFGSPEAAQNFRKLYPQFVDDGQDD